SWWNSYARRLVTVAHASGVQTAASPSNRTRCWVEFLILGLGVPAAIWAVSKLITVCIPAAAHGSAGQRFLLWISGRVVVEWAFVIVLAFALRGRGLSFKD